MKNYHHRFSLLGIVRSFKNAMRGFLVLLDNEYNLYIQIGCAVIVTICGFLFSISHIEWAIQITVIGLVIFSELANTAFEKTMDLVHPEYNEKVRDIKDLASASVLFMVLVSLFVAGHIYIPKLHLLI